MMPDARSMVQIATFMVPVSGGEAAQEDMNAFLRSHRVLQIEKAFAGNGWAFCVEWIDGAAARGRDWRQGRIDYRETLEPEAFARFAKLRERRKAIAMEDAVPPYMVMTDAQMAEAAKHETLRPEDLKAIEGFGEARMEKYAARLCGADNPPQAGEDSPVQ